MSILATSRPLRELAKADRVCFRCGLEWADTHQRWRARNAPCEQCRIMLRREGVDLTEYRRSSVTE